MVLSIFDIENFGFYFDIQPLRRLLDTSLSTAAQQEVQYYDYILRGNKLGVGREFADDEKKRPECELDVRGKIRCLELYMVSDARKKEDVALLAPGVCMDAVRDVDVFQYRFRQAAHPPGEVGTAAAPTAPLRVGFMAQQLQRLPGLPGIVAEDAEGLTVDQNQLLAVLLGAVKALDGRVQRMEALAAGGGAGAGEQSPCTAATQHAKRNAM